jgi:hypothetical protein
LANITHDSLGYRYGFNNQEKVDEISGSGNHTTAEFWEYDPRTGKRWNIDPIPKDWESPYSCLSDSPILNNDPNGDDDESAAQKTSGSKKGTNAEAEPSTSKQGENLNSPSHNSDLGGSGEKAQTSNVANKGIFKHISQDTKGEGEMAILASSKTESSPEEFKVKEVSAEETSKLNVHTSENTAEKIETSSETTQPKPRRQTPKQQAKKKKNSHSHTQTHTKKKVDLPHSEKMKQGNNTKKNQEVHSLYKQYHLNKDQQRDIHDLITGHGFTRKQIEAVIRDYLELFPK